MKRKEKQQDHITTWLQRGYYIIAITNELGLFILLKEVIAKLLDA